LIPTNVLENLTPQLYKHDSKMSLTTEGIRTIISMTSTSSNPAFQPVFQLISIKAVGNSNGVQRFRAVLSDGTHFVQGMLATQLNHMVESHELQNNAIISVQDFMNNSVQGRNVIILLKITVLSNPGERIGAPGDIEKAGAAPIANSGSGNGVQAEPMYNRTNAPTSNSYGQTKPDENSNRSTPKNPYSPATNRTNAPIIHRASESPGGTPITLISQLNMYQNRWVVKARVVSKSEIKTWSNARGEGSLFSVELLDSSGSDVKATFFKEAVDKFFNLFQIGKVYRLSGGRIKVANMQYNTCKSQFELNFDQNSEIRLVDDIGDIKTQSFELVKIADLEQAEVGKNVDVLAVVQDIGDVQSLTSKKTGKELQKCDLTLIDDTGVQVRLTLWGSQAMSAKNDILPKQVVAFKKARVGDFGGTSLSGANGVFVEPEIPETESLKQWWETQGSKGVAVKSLSSTSFGGGKMASFGERKSIADIKNQNLGYNNDKGDYLSFKAHFSFIKKDKEGGAWYTACMNKEEPCRNRCKVTQTTDGNWQCDRCQGTYPECTRKWIFSATVADDTASTWVSIFDDQAMNLFGGATADEVHAQYDNQDIYDSYFAKAMHTEWILKCKVKNEIVNDEPRLKTQVVRMDPVDYAAECRDMLIEIQKFGI
jgi:replication factor A1